jgi:aspartate/methionine/tyrosine aminotransferase
LREVRQLAAKKTINMELGSDLQPAAIVAAIVAAIQDECTSMSYQGLPELRLWLILCQKLWCNTQPCNRNFAFDGF